LRFATSVEVTGARNARLACLCRSRLTRANWRFCGSAEGDRTAAALYSVVGTCKHLGIDPFAYLREALPALFSLGETACEEALAHWLPDVWQQQQGQPFMGRG
jgi:hypothetical protein